MTDDEQEAFHRDFALGAEDYLRLPNYGHGWINLRDAALLAALDNWASGADPVPPFDEVRPGQTYHPRVREFVRPLAEQLTAAFQRSISLGELRAEILERDFPSLAPNPERTYIEIGEIGRCMDLYGLERYGDIIRWVEDEDDEDTIGWECAARVARRRAAFRLGVPADEAASLSESSGSEDDVETLRKKVQEQALYIAHLTRNTASVPRDEKELTERERTSLLNTVGALLEVVLPQYRGKQDALINDIRQRWPHAPGLSESNLQRLLPRARSRLKSTC